ncbi:protease IV [Sorangium cellulosum]|uniref:Protease IV n=1 Tax=Sorangium cellulosum TaxID=56 RepID=A0A2L0EJ06_SORCE|nr:signal peptide peptidase SppA [Sorangium cellulosum]AUX39269.1 protease IV [Sorangium cellulosum]
MIAALLINLFRLLLLPLSALRWAFAAPRGGYVVLDIDGRVVDLQPPRVRLSLWWRPRTRAPLSVERVRELGKHLRKDARPAGLLLRMRSVHAGPAVIASLRDALLEIRAGGKDVVAYLPMGADNTMLLLASAARAVIVGPETLVSPLGFAVEGRYVRRALSQAGVEPEVFAKGMYKNAGEVLVRDDMSAPQREQVGALLDARLGELTAALAQGRRVDRETAARWIDEAPHGAEQAVERGIVDAVAYEDELEHLLATGALPGGIPPRRAGAIAVAPAGEGAGAAARPSRARLVAASRYLAARRALELRPMLPRPILGVVEVHGAIVSRARFRGASLASEERLVASLRAARQNPRIRGVILHIDSPGGSALASDRIHHEVTRLAEVKPVVACLSNVAASGGYYVAAAAHAIVAQPQTITGSIGVVSARFALGPLLDRLGVSTDVVKRGARADLFSSSRKLDEGERAVMERELDAFYATFLRVVASGRRRPVAEIEPLAQGRVYSGADAQARGLVDMLGGFERALHELRQMIGPKAAAIEPAIVRASRYIPPPPLLPAPVPTLLELVGLRGVADQVALAMHCEGERVLAYCAEALEQGDGCAR